MMNDNNDNTLYITIGNAFDMLDAQSDNMDAALSGDSESIEGPRRHLNFHSVNQFRETFTEDTIVLLRAVRQDSPNDTRELAETLGRDVTAVESNVRTLADYGLVELTEGGRPVLPYDSMEFDLTSDPTDIVRHTADA